MAASTNVILERVRINMTDAARRDLEKANMPGSMLWMDCEEDPAMRALLVARVLCAHYEISSTSGPGFKCNACGERWYRP